MTSDGQEQVQCAKARSAGDMEAQAAGTMRLELKPVRLVRLVRLVIDETDSGRVEWMDRKAFGAHRVRGPETRGSTKRVVHWKGSG